MARNLLLVFTGGALGTALRAGVTGWLDQLSKLPLGTLAVNLVGAFLLGLLVSLLARSGNDSATHPLRLLFGTGLLGGFTTYSMLSTDTAMLLDANHPKIALAYALITLIFGLLASWLGLLAGGARRRSA